MSDRQWLSQRLALPHARKRACLRGLDFIFGLAMQSTNFDAFGEDALQCFLETASVTGDPIRRRVLLYVEALGHRLRHETRRRGWVHGLYPTPMEVMDAIVSSHCLERMGLSADFKLELVSFLGVESAGGPAEGRAAQTITSSSPAVSVGPRRDDVCGETDLAGGDAAIAAAAVDVARRSPTNMPQPISPQLANARESGAQQPKRRAARLASRKGDFAEDAAAEAAAPHQPHRGLPLFRRPTRLSKEKWDDPLLADEGAKSCIAAPGTAAQPPPIGAAVSDLPPSPAPGDEASRADAPPSAPARPAGATGMYIHTRPVAWCTADYLGWDAAAGPPPTGYVQPELCTRCGMPNARRIETCAACNGPVRWDRGVHCLARACQPPFLSGRSCSCLHGASFQTRLWRPTTPSGSAIASASRPSAASGMQMCCSGYLAFAPTALPPSYRGTASWVSGKHPNLCTRIPPGPKLDPLALADQSYLVTHVVLTLSNYGTLRLHPAALPHEFFFLREHLPLHMRQGDVHLVGEGVECLRVFGCDEADPLVRAALEWLLARQVRRTSQRGDIHRSDRCTTRAELGRVLGPRSHARRAHKRRVHNLPCDDDSRAGQSASWRCLRLRYVGPAPSARTTQALMVHAHRGWGPGVPAAQALVEAWAADGHGLLPLPMAVALPVGTGIELVDQPEASTTTSAAVT